MRYLFFDTECSNEYGGIHKMCEFGYVLADEAFAYEESNKKDLLMSPGGDKDSRFQFWREKGRPGLSHPHEEYYRFPEFPAFHKTLKDILEQEDLLVFLWASDNDVSALIDSCNRYQLEHYRYVSYDVQVFFLHYFGKDCLKHSLENVYEWLYQNHEESMRAHNPADDAHMTMLVLKGMMEKLNKSLDELIQECPNARMDSLEHIAYVKKRAENRTKRIELERLASKDENDPSLICFGLSPLLRNNWDQSIPLVKEANEFGYLYHTDYAHCSYIVCLSEEEKERISKISIVERLRIKLCSSSEFKEVIHS